MAERFIKPSYQLQRSRDACVWVGFVELGLLTAYVTGYVTWINTGTIPSLYVFLPLFQIFHVYTWAALFVCGSGILATTYISFALVSYALALFGDLGGWIFRIIILMQCTFGSCGSNNRWSSSEFGLVFGLFLLDIVAFVCLIFVIGHTEGFVAAIYNRMVQLCGSNQNANWFGATPIHTNFARSYIGTVWQFDFWITLILSVLILLGLGVNSGFYYVLVFLIPHYFMWTVARAVSGTPATFPSDGWHDPYKIFSVFILYVIVLFTDTGGVVYSIVQVASCIFGAPVCNDLEIGLNLLLLALYIVLFILTCVMVIGTFNISGSLREQLNYFKPILLQVFGPVQKKLSKARRLRKRAEKRFKEIVKEDQEDDQTVMEYNMTQQDKKTQ